MTGAVRDWQTSAGVTLLIALKGKDGLVLADDSRGTFGDPRGVTAQNDSQQKADILAPHVAVLIARSCEVGMMVIDEVSARSRRVGCAGRHPSLASSERSCAAPQRVVSVGPSRLAYAVGPGRSDRCETRVGIHHVGLRGRR